MIAMTDEAQLQRVTERMAKIVVVEDEADLREILVDELMDMGHEIAEAVNGEEGLQLILEQNPDLILSDINMPKVSGRDLRERLIRDYPTHATIPFCYMSAFADRKDVEDGMSTGVSHYFTKPLDYDELEDWITDRVSD
jgi:CheY-like chemotaxis protein